MSNEKSRALFERAQRVIPGGVDSPVRAFKGVGGTPYFVERAEGAFIVDVDGTRYVDYVQSWGASILGHANAKVIEAVRDAALKGTTFGAPTESEVVLAEMITSAVPATQMVRLVSSGTEAAMTAIRLARGVTGRDKIVKFAGCYHGHSDTLLAASGSGVMTLGLSDSAGVASGAVADTAVARYNVVPELDEKVACVIVEPIAANMGLVVPEEGFLSGLRDACDAVGALLIFDEVITGFRLGYGSVSDQVGVEADLYCFGKVAGGGLPLAAIAGRKEHMELLAPTGPVYRPGTLSGNPLATAAGIATLRQLRDADYGALSARVARLATGVELALSAAGMAVSVPRFSTLMGIFFSEAAPTNYDEVRQRVSDDRYAKFFHAMLDEGVALAPSPYEVAFCSFAHDDEIIDQTIVAAEKAARAIALI